MSTATAERNRPETWLGHHGWDQPACVGHNPELWMADVRDRVRGQAAARRQEADIRFAKAICASCPLTDACLAAGERECGIWGGRTTAERGVTIFGHRRKFHYCDQCGKQYKPENHSQRYCGEECAKTAHLKQSRASYHRTRR